MQLLQTGYGDSPYQSFSTYAGNPYFIDLKTLIKEGLLTKKECKVYDFGEQAGSIDYEKIYNSRFKVLKKAFERFEKDEAYDNFIKENAYWLDDYSLYMAIKDSKGGISWNEWEEALKNREEAALENAREELAEEINFYKFQQYEFDKQWSQLHAYANEQGIQIVGDIPIYVAFDGADTWASPEMKKDKAKYFGPYTSSNAVKDSMELIRKLYHVRTCNRNLPRDIGKERPCLYYH